MKNNSFMSDVECRDLRNSLIKAGHIVPKKSSIIKKKSATTAPTRTRCKATRAKLIEMGIITPSNISTFVPSNIRRPGLEDGTYVAKPVANNTEYCRRRSAYLEVLREVLVSRRELKLNLDNKKDTDPDWYF